VKDETVNDRTDPSVALIFEAITAVAPELDDELDELDPAIDLWSEFQLDSMDHLSVMTRVAEATGRDIPERDYPRLLTLRQLLDYVTASAG
jgi:acyl carrier protein